MTDTAISLTEAEVRTLVNKAVYEAGSQNAFARKCGVSGALVSQCLLGHRPMAPSLIIGAGLMPVTRYVPVRRKGK